MELVLTEWAVWDWANTAKNGGRSLVTCFAYFLVSLIYKRIVWIMDTHNNIALVIMFLLDIYVEHIL